MHPIKRLAVRAKRAQRVLTMISDTEATFWKALSGLVLILTFTVLILNSVFVAKQDTIFRICYECKNVSTGLVMGFGMHTMDTDRDQIDFEYQSAVANSSGVTAILLRGPIVLGSLTGPITTALCGSPSNLVCSLTPPLKQTATAVYNGVHPVSNSVRPMMADIRRQPYLYYTEVLTNANPASPGECRAVMTGACGFA